MDKNDFPPIPEGWEPNLRLQAAASGQAIIAEPQKNEEESFSRF